jgi:hypothetical protein
MWASVVVEADPVADGSRRVLDDVEALAMDALLLQCPDRKRCLDPTFLLNL